jgi:hypothetical protein
MRGSSKSSHFLDVIFERRLSEHLKGLVSGIKLSLVLSCECLVGLSLLCVHVVLSIKLFLEHGLIYFALGNEGFGLFKLLFTCSEFSVLDKNLTLEFSMFGIELIGAFLEFLNSFSFFSGGKVECINNGDT